MVEIGHKSPWVRTWWPEHQIYAPMQTTNLYRLGLTNMYDLNDPDMDIWDRDCYDSWR
jgi:hypothetical protein